MTVKFPLPFGHRFGPKALTLDIRFHDPASNPADQLTFHEFQQEIRRCWRSDLKPSGMFDGPTQRAVLEVQRVSGLLLTGWVDEETWNAVYSREPLDETAPETPLESTETDENPEGVSQGGSESEPVSDGSELIVIPATSPLVKRGPGRPPKK